MGALGIGTQAIGFALDVGASKINNNMAIEREHEARSENFKYGEMSADNALARQEYMLNKYYTPEAQMEHLKAAGLSPSLMYGGAGTTGQTNAPQGSGSGNISPNVFGLNPIAAAQVANLMAGANKQNAEADTIKGNNARGQAEIHKILEEAGAFHADANLKEAIKEYQNVQNYIAEATKDFSIEQVETNLNTAIAKMQQAYEEANQAGFKTQIDQKTFKAQIAQHWLNVANSIEDLAVKEAGRKLTEAETKEVQKATSLMEAELTAKYLQIFVNADIENRRLDLKDKEIDAIVQNVKNQIGANKEIAWINGGIKLGAVLLGAIAGFFVGGPAGAFAGGALGISGGSVAGELWTTNATK